MQEAPDRQREEKWQPQLPHKEARTTRGEARDVEVQPVLRRLCEGHYQLEAAPQKEHEKMHLKEHQQEEGRNAVEVDR